MASSSASIATSDGLVGPATWAPAPAPRYRELECINVPGLSHASASSSDVSSTRRGGGSAGEAASHVRRVYRPVSDCEARCTDGAASKLAIGELQG